MLVGGLLQANALPGGGWDIPAVFASLAEKHPPAAAGASLAGARCADNEPLAKAFDVCAATTEDAFKRNTFNLCARAIRLWPTKILKGKELSEGARKVKGIGKSCQIMIDEFITTGKLELRK